MWASIMSLHEAWFSWDTQLRQLRKAARVAARYRDLGLACPPPNHACVGTRPLIKDKPKNVLARGFAPPR